MAMNGKRSRSSSPSSSLTATTTKPLHNFDLPRGLKWGNQRFLRCMKVNSNDEISERRRTLSSSQPPTPIPTPSVVAGGRGGSASAEVVSVSVSNGSKSIAGKRKGKDKFDDDPIPSRRRGSEQGFNFKLPPLPFQRPSSSSAIESCRKYRSSDTGGGGGGGGGEGVGDGIAAVRKKLMNDLQTAADKMKVAILGGGLITEEKGNRPLPSPAPKVPTTVTSSATADAPVRPWNLRTRRAACMEPPTTPTSTNSGFFSRSPSIGKVYGTSPGSMASTTDDVNHDVVVSSSSRVGCNKSSRLRSSVSAAAAAATPTDRENERPKFSVSLSQREIEQDFLTFANRKPARRPRKRDKNVQRRLDTLFPGLWLSEITADMYKVQETPQQQQQQ